MEVACYLLWLLAFQIFVLIFQARTLVGAQSRLPFNVPASHLIR